MPQGWREALASAGMDTALERLLPSLRGHSWDKAVTFLPLLGKSTQDKSFLNRPKFHLFHNPPGNLGNTISPFQPCQAAGSNLGMGSCAGHSKAPEAVAATRQPEILPGTTWWFRRSTGYISDTQNLSSLFYFKLFISCMISVSIATLIQCAQDLFLVPVSMGKDSAKSKLLFLRAKTSLATSKLSIPPDPCQLLNFAGYPHADSLGQKQVKICVNNLPRWDWECFLGICSWQGHVSNVQKDPRNSSQSGTISQKGLGQLQTKPSWSNFHGQFWGPKKVCSRDFQKDLQFYQPCSLIFAGQTLLTCLKPRGASIFIGKKSAFSLMVSWTEGNYGKAWWFNSYYGNSIMTARLKMSFMNCHKAGEHDNERVNYPSIWGWYYPSATLIN